MQPRRVLGAIGRSIHRMSLVFRFAAPYLAVAVFWFCIPNAWLATLAYHALILTHTMQGVISLL